MPTPRCELTEARWITSKTAPANLPPASNLRPPFIRRPERTGSVWRAAVQGQHFVRDPAARLPRRRDARMRCRPRLPGKPDLQKQFLGPVQRAAQSVQPRTEGALRHQQLRVRPDGVQRVRHRLEHVHAAVVEQAGSGTGMPINENKHTNKFACIHIRISNPVYSGSG